MISTRLRRIVGCVVLALAAAPAAFAQSFQLIEVQPSVPGGKDANGQLVAPVGPLNPPRAGNAVLGQGFVNEVEPNGTSATATPLGGTNVVALGAVYAPADVDFYSFTATANDRVYVAVQTLFDASASGDSLLDVLDTDGSTVLENDPNDGTFNASSSSIACAHTAFM